jgi:hypothetical protein
VFCTFTSTAPATADGGTFVVNVVGLITCVFVPGFVPNVTAAPAPKFVPVIVTVVPPVDGPLPGDTDPTVGKGVPKRKPPASVPVPLSVFVTVTFPVLCAHAGVVAVIVVAFTTVMLVAAAQPIVTVAPARKSVPLIVTGVPPEGEPLSGVMLVTVGVDVAMDVKPLVSVAVPPSGFVTVIVTVPGAHAGVIVSICVAV